MEEHKTALRSARRALLLCAAACLAAGLVFRFALIGYGTLALCFWGLGAVLVLYAFLPKPGIVALSLLLAAGLALFLSAEIPVLRAAAGDGDVEADYVIVLGAGVNGTVPSLSLTDRLRAAEAYLTAHPDCVAIVSGGQGEGELVTEAACMFRYLTDRGIPAERIWLEERATATRENLLYSFALLPEGETPAVAVLSSEYHLYRAKYLAGSMGREVYGIPARTSLPVLRANYFIREGLGMVYYRVFGMR